MLNKLKKIRYNKIYYPSCAKKVFYDNLGIIGQNPGTEKSLENIFKWIRASFEANKDGGSAAYYRFRTGWKGSYPETTGYLIPTMYDYAKYTGNEEWKNISELHSP